MQIQGADSHGVAMESSVKKLLGTAATIIVIGLIAFSKQIGGNFADHILPTPKPETTAQQQPTPAPAAPAQSNAFITLSSHSGISNMTIIPSGKIGILNEDTEGAAMKNVSVSGKQDIGIANIRSKNPVMQNTTVESK